MSNTYLDKAIEAVPELGNRISLFTKYGKALISTIYDCALRVSEACSLKWIDISFERQQVFIYQGKAKKDRCVQISEQLLRLLPAAIALNLVACHQRDARMYHQYRKLGRRSHILISVMRRAGRLVSARIVVASASS